MAEKPTLYIGVVSKMLNLIDSGDFPAGGRLPPERELAEGDADKKFHHIIAQATRNTMLV